jgi:tripartite-type tricarboxylate transporter receptor subunit TctC
MLIFMKNLLLALLMALNGLPCSSQSFPFKPIDLVVPFPAGGSTDLLARALGQQLSSQFGQQVVIDNKPGAGGSIGSNIVSKAKDDGHTILFTSSSTHAIGPSLSKNLPYNIDTDFIPIVHVANATNILLLTKTIPVNNLKELIAYLKNNPGKLNYASSGNGTIIHLTAEAFKADAGVSITHIPYKGSGQAIPDIISGKVHMVFDSIVSAMPHVLDGKLTAIAVTGKKRSALAPDVPTMMEAGKDFGLSNFQSDTWWGLYAPKGTSAEIISFINAETNKALLNLKLKDRLNFLGAEAFGGTPGQFASMAKIDRLKWAEIIQRNNITQD